MHNAQEFPELSLVYLQNEHVSLFHGSCQEVEYSCANHQELVCLSLQLTPEKQFDLDVRYARICRDSLLSNVRIRGFVINQKGIYLSVQQEDCPEGRHPDKTSDNSP